MHLINNTEDKCEKSVCVHGCACVFSERKTQFSWGGAYGWVGIFGGFLALCVSKVRLPVRGFAITMMGAAEKLVVPLPSCCPGSAAWRQITKCNWALESVHSCGSLCAGGSQETPRTAGEHLRRGFCFWQPYVEVCTELPFMAQTASVVPSSPQKAPGVWPQAVMKSEWNCKRLGGFHTHCSCPCQSAGKVGL